MLDTITNNPLFRTFPRTVEDHRAELAAARAALLEELQHEHAAPPEGRWSAVEIAYHLHIVEKGIVRGLQKFFAEQRHEPVPIEAIEAKWHSNNAALLDRSLKAPAPERAIPLNPPPLQDVLALLEQSRAALLQFLEGKSYTDLASVSFLHALFGVISGPLWLSMIAEHEVRHVEQMRELRK
jgi:hypothetical protein